MGVFKKSPSKSKLRLDYTVGGAGTSLLNLPCFNNLAQHIWLRFIPHQMRIFFSAVIVNLESLKIFRVLNQQLDWLRAVLRGSQRVAQYIRSKAPSIYRCEFHSRPNARSRR